MEKLEVKFEVEKEWDSEYQKYNATITVMLPADLAGLHTLLRDRWKGVAGEKLTVGWGKKNGEWRVSSIYLTAADITELEEKVREEIERVVETLKEVVKINREAIKRLEGKEREVYVYQIF